jgi:hypothetical protein
MYVTMPKFAVQNRQSPNIFGQKYPEHFGSSTTKALEPRAYRRPSETQFLPIPLCPCLFDGSARQWLLTLATTSLLRVSYESPTSPSRSLPLVALVAHSTSVIFMSTSSPAPASFASVVTIRKEHLDGWIFLDSNEALTQLHTKFWGTGMPEDDVWRDDDPTESEDVQDDDIRGGCRVLNIENEAIDLNEIWVRVSVFTYNW